MTNRTPFGVGEWYHCFSRGVDKRRTFQNAKDYNRFLQLMYVSNTSEPMPRRMLGKSHNKVFESDRGKSLVSIGAYALMPNHFHILMQEVNEGGIAKFMQRVGIGYAMYFNKKNDRVGNLFVKPFRSKHIDDDAYLKRVAQYIHLNPIELHEPQWKLGRAKDLSRIESVLRDYRYSSLSAYENQLTPEKAILSEDAIMTIGADMPHIREIIVDADLYYKELGLEP